MLRFRFILYFLIYPAIILTFTFCKEKNTDTYRILNTAESVIEQYPDSTLILLDSIKNIDELDERQYSLYNLLLIQVKDKRQEDISSDTIIFKIKDFYIEKNDLEKSAISAFYCGQVFQKTGKYKDAVAEFLIAERYAQTIENYNLLGKINTAIGTISLIQMYENDAIKYLLKSIVYFSQSSNVEKEIDALNLVGSAYMKKADNDSAFFYYNKAKELAFIAKDTLRLASSVQCIGVAYLQVDNLKKAKANLRESLALFKNSQTGQAGALLNLARVFEKENLTDSARYYMDKSLSIQEQYKNDRLLCGTYQVLAEIEENNQNYQKALSYYKNYNKYLMLVYEEDENAKIIELQKKYQFEVLENEKNKLVLQRQKIILFSSLAFLIISLVALFFIIKSFKNKKAILLAEKGTIEAERKIYQLMEIAKSFNEKEDTFRNVLLRHFNILKKSALLEQYTKGDNEHDARLIKIFNEIVYGQESLNWDILYKTMNELHDGFFDRLKNKYPQLDEQEFRICCLTYTKFSSSDIALIMELKTNTVQMKRSSIRKKMEIEPLGNISDFLDTQLNTLK